MEKSRGGSTDKTEPAEKKTRGTRKAAPKLQRWPLLGKAGRGEQPPRGTDLGVVQKIESKGKEPVVGTGRAKERAIIGGVEHDLVVKG